MRSLRTILVGATALLALAGCQKEAEPTLTPTTEIAPVGTTPAGGAAAPGGQLPPGVQAKDVPGMGAPPPAGSPEAQQGGAPTNQTTQ